MSSLNATERPNAPGVWDVAGEIVVIAGELWMCTCGQQYTYWGRGHVRYTRCAHRDAVKEAMEVTCLRGLTEPRKGYPSQVHKAVEDDNNK